MEYKLRAKVSEKIQENNIIRLGKQARNKVGKTPHCYLDAWTNPFTKPRLCEVRQAFGSDLTTIPRNEREIAFISQHVYDMYASTDGHITLSSKKNTCIGSDPEFIIFGKAKNDKLDVMLHAADILSFESPIGSDGPLGELRACPGLTPKEHINNLRELINDIYTKLDPNKYKCKIFPYLDNQWKYLYEYEENCSTDKSTIVTCGGHIHFGLTSKITSTYEKILVDILDRTIAVCMHRVDMDMSSKRINEGGYGHLNDYKIGDNTLEYRGLSGTWLLYEDLTTTVLTIMNNLVETIVTKINERIDDTNDTTWTVTGAPGMVYSNRKTITLELFPELIPLFETCSSYPQLYDIFTKNPDETNIFDYINKVLDSLHLLIDGPELNKFSNLVTTNYDSYKKLDPNFIENWASNISVFDHLN